MALLVMLAIDHKALHDTFSSYGNILSCKTTTYSNGIVMRDADEKSRCFGFVNFDNAEDAANIVEALNGKKFDDEEWYVGKAQKKSERAGIERKV